MTIKFDIAEIYDFAEDFFYVFTLDADGACITGHAVERPEDGTLSALLADLAENGTITWDNALDDLEANYKAMSKHYGVTNDPRVVATAWPESSDGPKGYQVWERALSRFGRAWAGLEALED